MLIKDRLNRQWGGVAILCKKVTKAGRVLISIRMPLVQDHYGKLRVLHCSSTPHPPAPVYPADKLVEFLNYSSCERLLSQIPTTNIIDRDMNRLDIKDLLNQLSLAQIVKDQTRGNNILDTFITNAPRLCRKASMVKSLLQSDHSVVLTKPVIPTE